MKITILGATGATGQELIKQGVEQKHQVTALVRNPAGIKMIAPNLEVISGNVLDPQQSARAVMGSDAVISVLGFKRGAASVTIYSDSARILIDAMRQTGVRRLIFCTSAGVEYRDPNELWFYTYIFKPLFLKNGYADMQIAEKLIRASDLEWILVRPALLTNGELKGIYRVSPLYRPKRGINISRADLAHFMLQQLKSKDWLHKTPTLTY